MFSQGKRVTTSEFDLVMKQGNVFHVPHFTLRLIKEKGLPVSLFSVVTPKSVVKLAVGRNKLKRQMRTLLKSSVSSTLSGFKGVLFAKKGAQTITYNEMREEIKIICRKAGIFLE